MTILTEKLHFYLLFIRQLTALMHFYMVPIL